MVKVLWIVSEDFEGSAGGGQRYTTELSSALRVRGDVSLHVVKANERWQVSTATRTAPPSARRLRAVARLARGADVIHVHQLNSPGFDIGVIVSQATQTPLVLTDHGGGWVTPGRLLGQRRLAAVTYAAVVSDCSREDMGMSSERATAVFGGGDHVLERSVQAELRPVDYLFVGRLLPHKGVHLAIEALPSHQTMRVAGAVVPGSEWYELELRRLAQGKAVEFLPNVPDALLSSLYRSAGYTLLPSTHYAYGKTWKRPELLGIVLLESLSCETPAIGASTGGIPEVLGPLGMPLFDVTTRGDLARLLRTLPPPGSEAHSKLKEIASCSRQKFTWAATADRVVNIYRDLKVLRSQ